MYLKGHDCTIWVPPLNCFWHGMGFDGVLTNMFPGVSSQGMVTPYDPRLDTTRLHLWGYLKSEVYISTPWTLEALKENIKWKIRETGINMLERVMATVHQKINKCIEKEDGRLINIILKSNFFVINKLHFFWWVNHVFFFYIPTP